MSPSAEHVNVDIYPNLGLPVSLLTRYLFFLTRRPISASNLHYLHQRLDGLKSLAPLLQEGDVASLHETVRYLRAINPTNFHRLGERLQLALAPLSRMANTIPPDVVVSNRSPPADFLRSARRVLLLLGPAIGIGDEIILFPLPRWMKAANPAIEITTLSAYPGLWERVNDVDHVLEYRDYLSMVQALRGEDPFDGFDLVMLADFERPDLYPSICQEARLERYIELSLGAQSLFLVDNRRRWLHRAPRPMPYFANYYFGLDYLLTWLGLVPRAEDRFSATVRRDRRNACDSVRVYVNPFTSKHDPAEPFWSHLLSALVPYPPVRPIQFLLDPGPNSTTRRFASALAYSSQARTPVGVDFVIAAPEDVSPASVATLLSRIESAQIVVCTDSFAAHAAPLFGCATFVISGAGLENWRAPYPSSYYFAAEAPVDEIAAGIRQVLQDGFGVESSHANNRPPLAEPEVNLETITRELQQLFDNQETDEDFASLCRRYCDFIQAYQAAIARLPLWPPTFRGLLSDDAYPRPVSLLPALDTGKTFPNHLKPDLFLHLRDRWQQWQNTNLCKYLGLMLGAAAGASSVPE